MSKLETTAVILGVLLTISLTTQISGGVRREGGLLPYAKTVLQAIGGKIEQ